MHSSRQGSALRVPQDQDQLGSQLGGAELQAADHAALPGEGEVGLMLRNFNEVTTTLRKPMVWHISFLSLMVN